MMAAPVSSIPHISNLATSGESENEKAPTIRFTGVEELFREINRVSGDFLVVTHVSPHDFDQIDRLRCQARPKGRKFRLRRYHADAGILVVTIPTELHESLHIQLYEGFRDQLVESGKSDSSGGPDPERASKGAWPTLVIEAGVSESLNELHEDMRWWFAASDHQVKIVLLTKFDLARSAIFLERWEEESCIARPGPTTTRYATASYPVLRQRIVITRDTTTNPVSYLVTSGALILPFRLLFIREPGSGEGDFVISIPALESYARTAWLLV
ncbi:unnamed protein product [Parascedosporium putredinis]|uniref:Uncharacterized protein n=1 Tax=Parascedosporium putredinis TaxID=1442378 RepID=A0A9P1H5Z5_9PEZI|nr:unnamed protein product [Parascedosporium putredinis]CAI7996982.1 unnamed protein product [Parascedosporium putredinis]